MADITSIQGDSIAYDFYTDSIDTFDSDWGGSWAIVDTIPPTNTLATGSLSISGDQTKLEARILPADTDAIPVGKYYLVVEINNSVISFNQEVMQSKLIIKAQGI
jgi:hypothetical protein